MRSGRKVLLWVGVPVALILLALLLIPVLFEDRIAARARLEIEKRVDARVDWADAGLTFFRNFPNVTLTLEDLSVLGMDRFEGDTLAFVPGFRLVIDAASILFGDQTVVRAIVLDRPVVNLLVLDDGRANWDIMKARDDTPAAATPDGGGLNIGLRRLGIRGARITFENRRAGTRATLVDFDHVLRGDFTRDRFTIDTRTEAADVTVRSAGVAWLAGVALDVVADVDADMTTRRFTFGENEVRLNELLLAFTGSVTAPENGDIELDVRFESPDNDFASLLSLVPAVHASNFESLETQGVLSVAGQVTGHYGEDAFPALSVQARVTDASLKYPDLPLPAREIALDLSIDNPGGDADSTVIDLRRLHARIGDDAIAAAMTIRTPISDPDVDANVNGTLDLGAASRTFRLDGVSELAGIVNADFEVHARKSAVVAQRYDRVAASGDIVARDVAVRAEALRQPVRIDEMALGLTPAAAELRTFRGAIGTSDVRATGSIDNLLGFVMGEDVLRGSVTLESDRFDLDEWKSEDDTLSAIRVPPRLDFVLRTAIGELHHGRLDMTDARGLVRIRDQRLTMDSIRLNAVGGEFRLTGWYDTTDPERPGFDIDVSIDDADVVQSFEALTTVRMLAPVARYAEGRFTTNLHLTGALAENMSPVLSALTGRGALETTQLVLQNFPPMERLADALKSTRLQNPALRAISTAIDIRDGRLHVRPFDTGIGPTTLTVGGSNGIDRTLDYNLVLALPQSSLENAARQTVADLFARVGASASLDSMSIVQVAIRMTGTIDDPSIDLNAGQGVRTALQSMEQAAQDAVERTQQELEARADSANAAARRRAEAEAQRLIDEAEQRADVIRNEARELAETIRREAAERADSLVARASSPIARIAAERAASALRNEADDRANQITREADERANGIVESARERSNELLRTGGAPPLDTLRTDTMSADTLATQRPAVSPAIGPKGSANG